MTRSVSTLGRSSGAATASSRVKGVIGQRGSRGSTPRRRTSVSRPVTAAAAAIAGLMRWVRAPRPLPALEVPVGGRRDALAGTRRIAVHRDAHRAPGLAPLEAGIAEDAVEALGLRGAPDQPRAGDDHRGHDRSPPAHDRRRRTQVLDPAVRARPDEDAVDRDRLERRARREPHVGERADQAGAPDRVPHRRRVGHGTRDGPAVLGARAPGHGRRDPGRIQRDLAVEARIRVGRERAPFGERSSPARHPAARAAGPRGRRRSSRPAPPCPRESLPRSPCCRGSSAPPSRARGPPGPRTPARTPCRHPRRWSRSGGGPGPWRRRRAQVGRPPRPA